MRTDLRRALIYAAAGLVALLLFVAIVASCAAYDLGHISYSR